MKAKGQGAVDDLLKDTSKINLFSSFKAEENTLQWLPWLDILDQQPINQGLAGLNVDSDLHKDKNKQQQSLKLESKSGKGFPTKDSLDWSVNIGSMFGRGLQSSGDKYSTLKIPEAMVAIAQAAKDFPGWPLMSNKMQLHKCEKCSQEFYSPLNQRRHMRATHRRPLNGDKEDLKKKREQLAAFWDKLSPEDAREIVSVKSLLLMDLSATTVVRTLTTQLQQPSLLLLPQTYVKVATALLDLVQNKIAKVPLKSGDLFVILEDASERNMLCGVTSSSMHRCIFDNDPSRVGLETKNAAASLGFLVEYKLVRAWMDDKDAEALRCQKALVEEEEAAQKKLAKLLERKKQRKLRQKEFKDKERRSMESSAGLQELKLDGFARDGEDFLTATQSSPSSSDSSGLDLHSMETPQRANGDCEEVKFSSDCLEVGQMLERPDGAEENRSGCSTDVSSQNFETLNDSVEERDAKAFTVSPLNGVGWKERRQLDVPYFQNYGKQLYGKERKHYDHGVHRSGRSPRGLSTFEHFTPRYGLYREKALPVKRQSAVVGTSYAVWARKTPLTSIAVCQDNQTGEMNECESREDCTGAEPAGQSERSECDDRSSSLKSEKGLSRVSSLSSDSATSHSSLSISAKVGAEEQDLPESKTIPASWPPPMTLAEGDFGGSVALVIGSVSIPLECPLPVIRMDGSLLKETNPVFDVKSEGKSTVPDGPGSSSLDRGVEGSQLPCTDECLIPRGESSHQSGSREDSASLSKGVSLGVQNKCVIEVWRPVTPGGEFDVFHFGGPTVADAETLTEHGQEAVVNLRKSSPMQPQHSLCGSDDEGGILNREQVAHKSAFEGTAISVFEDCLQPPDSSLTVYYSELANFLTQRWSKAMSSPDIVCHNELDDFASGKAG